MAARKAGAALLSRVFSGGLRRPLLQPASLSPLINTTRGRRPYGAAAAAEDLETPVEPPYPVQYTKLLINGQFVESASGKTFPTIDPRSGQVITDVAEGDIEDVDRAVKAARKAFEEGPWPKMPPNERATIVNRFADLLDQHNDELAALDALDSGKPFDQARFIEMPGVSRGFRYYAGWADKIHGATLPSGGSYFAYTLHEPIGVVGAIVPWNFPMIMFVNQVAPALVLGNSVVLKTAEQSPLSALLAGKLALEAGIPPGVLNVISGYGPTAGAALSSHPDIDIVSFTGSTAAGRDVMVAAARSNLKRVGLELGGKSAFIICEDANVDEAVGLSQFAVFFNQGACCASGSRTLVHEKIYDEFMEKAKQKAMERVVGDPFQSGVEQGPQIDEEQFTRILGYIKKGEEQGASLVSGGARLGSKGYYIQPTVFGDVSENNVIFKEEIFGPVQSVTKFRTIEEAIQLTNSSIYGLAAGVMTKNMDTANTVSRALKAGTVWVNSYNVLDITLPFGGYKQSGFGRVKGMHALENFYQVKTVITPLKNPAWL
ncbi:unnamed protein product [Calypogeia fissa]